MSSLIVLALGTYPEGTRVLGPAAIPQGLSLLELDFTSAGMSDPALRLNILIDISLDNGVTWGSDRTDPNNRDVSFGFPGGATPPGGNYRVGLTLPSPASATRQIKATVTITGAPLTTQVTMVTS